MEFKTCAMNINFPEKVYCNLDTG